MAALTDSQKEDKKQSYKLVLAFWLGSNITREKFTMTLPWSYVYLGYYCFLILDRQISAVKSTEPLLCQIFSQCLQALMAYLNEHYEPLKDNPEQLFLKFKSIIETLDAKRMQSPQQLILNKTKQACLNELARALTPEQSAYRPLQETVTLNDPDIPPLKKLKYSAHLPFLLQKYQYYHI